MRGASLILGAALLTAACGNKDTSSSSGTPTADESDSERPASSGSAKQKQASASSPAAYPDSVDDIAAAVPEEASLVVTFPGASSLQIPKETMDQALAAITDDVTKKMGVSADTLKAVIQAHDGGAFFNLGDFSGSEPPAAVVLRFKEAKPVEDLIAELKPTKAGDNTWVLEKNGDKVRLAWLPKPKVAVLALREDALTAALDTLGKKRKSFAGSAHAKKVDATDAFVFADLFKLIPKQNGLVDEGSQVVGTMGLEHTDLALSEYGEKVPRIGNVLAPIDHGALAKLPGSPIAALDLSLARRPGKTLKDLFLEIGRASGTDFTPSVETTLKQLGDLSVADLDKALGESLTVGLYVPDGKPSLETLSSNFVVFGTIGIKDDKAIKSLFSGAQKALSKVKKKGKGAPEWSENKVVAEVDGRTLVVEILKDTVVVTWGNKEESEHLVSAFKKGDATFSKTPAYADYKSKATASQLTIFADYDTLVKLLPKESTASLPLKGTAGSDLILAESEKGLELQLKGSAAVAVLGAGAGMAIFGVRRYLASAKSSEAKNSIGAISRGAVGAYERETPSGKHALCKSAPPVPAKVESGKKYQPDSADGKDFNTGSADTGWKCLKFVVTAPMYYQYEYRVGGPFKCGGTGGPDEFEVSAEGDVDGDGITSLFCQRGAIVNGSVKIKPDIIIKNEYE